MDNHLLVVGEPVEENEWPEIKGMIKEVESCGFSVVKVINFKEGSVKFIARLSNGENMQIARKKLEDKNWRIGAPYYSHGNIVGFKVSRDRKANEVSDWG